jgi:hypothetical protein
MWEEPNNFLSYLYLSQGVVCLQDLSPHKRRAAAAGSADGEPTRSYLEGRNVDFTHLYSTGT